MRRSWATRGLLGALGAVVALAVALGLPGDADAHAVLERSAPVQSQQLAAPPELIETWYSESLRSLTKLEVLDVQGNRVHQGETIFSDDDPRYAAIAVEPALPPGIYTVTYQNVSRVDGHTWSGFFSFVVLNPDGTVPAGEPPVPKGLAGQVGSLPDNTDSALRWVGLLSAALLGGALFFAALVSGPAGQFLDVEPRRRVERSALVAASATVVPAAAAVALSTVAQLWLLADRLGGLGELGILVSTRTEELWLARTGLALALLVLSLPVLRSEAYRSGRHAPVAALLASVGALGLLMTYSLGSHAATGGGEFWAAGSDFVHSAATAAWLGALLQLPLLFWWTGRRLDGAERVLYRANALDRFSWLAVVSVVLLIGTGVFNGFVQLPTLESLWDTTYGRVLMAKLALIVLLLPVAAINAFLVKPALVRAIDALPRRAGGAAACAGPAAFRGAAGAPAVAVATHDDRGAGAGRGGARQRERVGAEHDGAGRAAPGGDAPLGQLCGDPTRRRPADGADDRSAGYHREHVYREADATSRHAVGRGAGRAAKRRIRRSEPAAERRADEHDRGSGGDGRPGDVVEAVGVAHAAGRLAAPGAHPPAGRGRRGQ